MNPMRKYDALLIFPPEEAPEAWKEEVKKIESAVSHLGGSTVDRQDWGRRPLGYALKKHREGHLLLLNIELDASKVSELRRTLHLNEKILKVNIFQTLQPKLPKRRATKKEQVHASQP